ncbi:MAG: FtsQ-type POTRA domain-containing protein [Magnetococcales bacterium]|nr:FtsQ-type POTRA domain-containing protein [Magnetococcales bacterium]
MGPALIRLTGVLLILGALSAWGWHVAMKKESFPLREVRLEGIINTDVERASRVLGVPKGTNLLHIDLPAARQRLIALPWVRDVQVERLYATGILVVTLTEKRAICLGRIGERLYLLSDNGQPIKPFEPTDRLTLPVVTPLEGEGSATSVVHIMEMLGRHGWLLSRLSEAVGHGNDRWTLYTTRGARILLSHQMEQELVLLRRLQKRFRILDRDIAQVDMRLTGKAAVRPRNLPAPS